MWAEKRGGGVKISASNWIAYDATENNTLNNPYIEEFCLQKPLLQIY
jgi:hypothetical protein